MIRRSASRETRRLGLLLLTRLDFLFPLSIQDERVRLAVDIGARKTAISAEKTIRKTYADSNDDGRGEDAAFSQHSSSELGPASGPGAAANSGAD